MTHTDTPIATIRAIIAEILALSPDEIDDTADLYDHYQADSLNLIEIVAQVEKQCQVVLPLDELPHARTITALHDLATTAPTSRHTTPALPADAGASQ